MNKVLYLKINQTTEYSGGGEDKESQVRYLLSKTK